MNEVESQACTLKVTVIPDVLPDETLRKDLVKVTVANTGGSPVTVAARLAIGYQDSDNREIYAVIRTRSTGELVGRRGQLYQRQSLPEDQVRTLIPGEEIGTEFHLLEWYEVPSGDLEIQIVYDSVEAAQKFPEIQPQKCASDFVPFRK